MKFEVLVFSRHTRDIGHVSSINGLGYYIAFHLAAQNQSITYISNRLALGKLTEQHTYQMCPTVIALLVLIGIMLTYKL